MVLEVKSLECGYESRPIITGINFALDNGEILSLLGPIGSGKSTLIKCILGTARRMRGCVCIDGKASTTLPHGEWAKLVAYVPQLLERPYMVKVIDMVVLGRLPYMGFRPRREDYEAAYEVLDRLGISYLANRFAHELSGGQYQLVHIARALLQRPRVLLLDEPVSTLDLKHQVVVMETIKRVAKEDGVSVVMAMHDVNLALKYSHKLLMLKGGRAVAYGLSPEVLSPFVIREVYDVNASMVWFNEGPRVII
ncbi:ABC transporter ATP-binding protein [Vulcanisaeta sp. JCM 16161]|uniref:ABC transporter ATP-binding protein n=1 Tax=Vulcanisaeta sp. JCM 16161 TaxID=1295372 RepID=UPI00406C9DBD